MTPGCSLVSEAERTHGVGASAYPMVSPIEDLPPPGQEGKVAEVEVQPEPASRAGICTLVSRLFLHCGKKT